MTELKLRAPVYWMISVGLLLFSLLAWQTVAGGPITLVDQKVNGWMLAQRTALLTSLLLALSFLHGTGGIFAMSFSIALVLKVQRRWTELRFLVAVIAGGMSLNWLLKLAFQRQRPDFHHALDSLSSYSFPSGHACGSTLLYCAIVLLLANSRWRWPAIAGASLMITLVGLSRVYLGAHYPSDVLAGVCVGVVWVSACWLFFYYSRPTRIT